MLVPLLMPSYLAYAGWGLVRGPGTLLGDWIARQEPWVSLAAGRAFAVAGLVLWVWPVSSLVQGPLLRRVPDSMLDALRIESSGARRARTVLRLLLPALGASAGAVGLLMIGSAVPLHVAQVQTAAIQLWKVIQESASARGAWIGALPLLIVVGLATVWIVRWIALALARQQDDDPDDLIVSCRGAAWRGARGWFWLVWVLSVPGPGLVFLLSLRQWRSLWDFWRVNQGAVEESLRTGAIVGAVAVVVALLVGMVLAARPIGRGGVSRGRRWWGVGMPPTAAVIVGVFVLLALVPGVLIGTAYNSAFPLQTGNLGGWLIGHGEVRVVLAHVARFGALPVLLAVRLAMLEPRAARHMRLLDEPGGGGTAWMGVGWWSSGWSSVVSYTQALVRPSVGAFVGLFLAVMCLSMHEIESTIMVQAPGSRPLAQVLLDQLHFARDEELSAACVNLLGMGIVLAIGSAWLIAPLLRANPVDATGQSSRRYPGGRALARPSHKEDH
jgi:ABC-type spermidine/putrescine transport system permease subunit II